MLDNKWMCISIMINPIVKLVLSVFIFGLTACTVGPNYAPPNILSPTKWASTSSNPPLQQEVYCAWWEGYHDPVLNLLVQQAIENNHDLKAAKARVFQVHANQLETFSKFFPEFKGQAFAARLNPGFITLNRPFSIAQATFNATWELDFFGGNRRRMESEHYLAQAQVLDHNAILLSLIGMVVNNYIDLRQNQLQLNLINKKISLTKEKISLASSLNRAGLASTFNVQDAKNGYQTLRSQQPEYYKAISRAKNKLSTLLGGYPGTLDKLLETTPSSLPTYKEALLLTEPAVVIRQRPDVAAAERQLASQMAKIGEATAKLFPDISIGGFYGKQGTTILPGSQIWGIAPQVYFPLINIGQVQGQINLAKAKEREAFFHYKQILFEAMEDVENQIIGLQMASIKEEQLSTKARENFLSFKIAKARQKGGLNNYISRVDYELSFLEARSEVLIATSEKLKGISALYKSLGVYPVCPCDKLSPSCDRKVTCSSKEEIK